MTPSRPDSSGTSQRDVLRPQARPARSERTSASIHPTAIVADEANLGSNVEIGAGAIVGPQVTLGDRVRVGARAILEGQLEVGEDTRIWPSAVLGCEPQDHHFDGSPSGVKIGARCAIREFATVHRASIPGGTTEVGSDVMLMTSAHVAHDCVVGDRATLAGGALLAGHVRVGPQAFLSGHVVVHQFVRIGRLAMIGGASAVSNDVPPFAMAVGRNWIRGLNSVGLRRSGVDGAEMTELRELFRIIRAAAPNVPNALEQLRKLATTEASRELVAFIEEPSRRGYSRIASAMRH